MTPQEEKEETKELNRHGIATRIEQSKRRLAEMLGEQSERLSIGQKKIVLIAFGVLSTMVCVALIARPFIKETPKQFSVPAPLALPPLNAITLESDSLIDRSTYNSLRRIRLAIDSLKYSDVGRARYDQLMRERPGLVDSLDQLLKKY